MACDGNQMKKKPLLCFCCFIFAAAAEIAGQLICSRSPGEQTLTLIPDVFSLQKTLNTGVAFSFLETSPVMAKLVCGALLLALAVFVLRGKMNLTARCALSAVLAGGLCNEMSRLLTGAVTDWIRAEFVDFPVFNLADVFVCAGTAVFCIAYLFDGRKTNHDRGMQ